MRTSELAMHLLVLAVQLARSDDNPEVRSDAEDAWRELLATHSERLATTVAVNGDAGSSNTELKMCTPLGRFADGSFDQTVGASSGDRAGIVARIRRGIQGRQPPSRNSR